MKKRLIIFLIPPEKIVNGGILSIFSICKTSRQFQDIHKAHVVLATYPGTKSYKKNDLFVNDEIIYSFDEIMSWGIPSFLQIHIPEYASFDTFKTLQAPKYMDYIGKINDLRVNILAQNILLMQKPAEVALWFSMTPTVTQTTAHNKYSNQDFADKYYLPTHHFSTFVDASQYTWTPYEKKEDLILLSPDITKEREAIVQTLEKHFPNYAIRTIQNLKYEDYKKLMSRAKYTITFGEGFDGYYVEAFFTGGMTFAVYNEDFFPDKGFAKFQNLYKSYDDMLNKIVNDITRLDNKITYQKIVKQNLDKINQLYSFAVYTQNVKKFYLGKFTYMPTEGSAKQLIGEIIREQERLLAAKDSVIKERHTTIKDMEKMIADKGKAINELDQVIGRFERSLSWKVTKPLRKVSSIIKR
jgi:hypothetical protein